MAAVLGPNSFHNRIPKKRKRDNVAKPSHGATRQILPKPLPVDSDEEDLFADENIISDYEYVSLSSETSVISPKRRRIELNASDAEDEAEGPKSKKKPYKCTFKDCDKAYSKPSRLQEHQRSHTGERPFKCDYLGCGKSYLRESHLQAHSRTHQPQTARPFVCPEASCGKRFWTSTQLKVHGSVHDGSTKTLKCSAHGCNESFSKHSQLRSHFAAAHCTPGTKPFLCDHEGCSKSFPTSQKLRSHSKTHQTNRYMCSVVDCIITGPQYFQTWTLLQAHIRTAHPPTCPFESCKDKTFSSQKNLKAHLKIHEERGHQSLLEDRMETDDEALAPRRRGGDVGRDWACDWEDCDKAFKSKKALTVHVNVNHLGQRNFICEHTNCGKAFGYKHLLQRHQAKLHGVHSSDQEESIALDEDEETITEEEQHPFIEHLTGKAYKRRADGKRVISCPWPAIVTPDSVPVQHCGGLFRRAYDLRRHLRADHGLEIEKDELNAWLKDKSRTSDI